MRWQAFVAGDRSSAAAACFKSYGGWVLDASAYLFRKSVGFLKQTGSPKGTSRHSISGPKPKLNGRFDLPALTTAAKVSKPITAAAKAMARMSPRLSLAIVAMLLFPRPAHKAIYCYLMTTLICVPPGAKWNVIVTGVVCCCSVS